MPKIPVVNENDDLLEYKERESLDQKDIYRVSALWLTNSQGQILLAQRALNKSHDPGRWGPAVAGTVEEGEDYEKNILKEIKEELGLNEIKLNKSIKIRRKTKYNYFVQWFTAVINKTENEFKIQKAEVEKIKWFTKEELKKELQNNPDNFTSGFKDYLKIFS